VNPADWLPNFLQNQATRRRTAIPISWS
jgi:hypothetical protein